jgi:ribosomal RNA methyltransferase Nop2
MTENAEDVDNNVAIGEDQHDKKEQEDVGFNSEEDRPYLEEAKRRRMKAKGLRPPPRTKVQAAVVKATA